MKGYSSVGESNPGLPCDSREWLPLYHDGLMEVKDNFCNFKLLKHSARRRRHQRGTAGAILYVLICSK